MENLVLSPDDIWYVISAFLPKSRSVARTLVTVVPEMHKIVLGYFIHTKILQKISRLCGAMATTLGMLGG